MEETGRDRGKLCELTLTRPLQSVPIIGSMLCAYFVLLVVLALPFTPTLTDLLPAHLHLRHSYTLSLHMLSQITIHSHLPHAHSHALHMHFRRYLHSPSLSHTLLHTLQQISLMSLRGYCLLREERDLPGPCTRAGKSWGVLSPL